MKSKCRKESIQRWLKEKEAWKKDAKFKDVYVQLTLRKVKKETFHKICIGVIND